MKLKTFSQINGKKKEKDLLRSKMKMETLLPFYRNKKDYKRKI